MPRIIAECNKAICEAWRKEQELVKNGKGTRDWTLQQQQQILEKGKAYDESGKAFEGQHMKSAEKYPEYQGNPGNIQFLTRTEHLEAHDGNWQNPTNWYYNPITKKKIDFGDGPFIPCEIVQLRESIVTPSITIDKKEETLRKTTENIKAKNTKETPKIKQEAMKESLKSASKLKPNIKQLGGFKNTVKKAIDALADFPNRHPVLTGLVKAVGVVGLTAAAGTIVKRENSSPGNYSYSPSSTRSSIFNDGYDEVLSDEICTDTSVKRSSPKEHIVRNHGQHYTKNGERVWIEKDAFPRGGNKDK